MEMATHDTLAVTWKKLHSQLYRSLTKSGLSIRTPQEAMNCLLTIWEPTTHGETMPATNRPSLDGALGNYDISATIKDAEPTLHRTSILPNLDGIPAREPVYPPWHENHVSKVLTYSPKKGTVGTAVEVRCRSNSNNFHSQSLNVSLVFGGCCVPAKILTIKPQAIDTCFRYVVGCSAPPLPGPNSSSDLVRLRLLQDATLLDVGPWQYEDGYKLGLSTSPLNKCRKLRLFSA